MVIRRTIVWLTSILFGAISSTGTSLALNTTLGRFSLATTSLIFLSAGSLVFIWLDYFLKTDYLRT